VDCGVEAYACFRNKMATQL